MKPILITTIPHSQQRYVTCGDYIDDGQGLAITISALPDERMERLVAIHELIEWAICQATGVTNEQVDAFDIHGPGHDIALDNLEPGDDARAPYYHAHQIATGIERILAAEMGVSWQEYEKHILELK